MERLYRFLKGSLEDHFALFMYSVFRRYLIKKNMLYMTWHAIRPYSSNEFTIINVLFLEFFIIETYFS